MYAFEACVGSERRNSGKLEHVCAWNNRKASVLDAAGTKRHACTLTINTSQDSWNNPDNLDKVRTLSPNKNTQKVFGNRMRRWSDLRVVSALFFRCYTFVLVFFWLTSHGEVLGDERLNEAVHLCPPRWEHYIALLGSVRLRGLRSIVLTRQWALHN